MPRGARHRPGLIKNKAKRSEVLAKQRIVKAKEKRERRDKRRREADELGELAPPKQQPRTLESTREVEETKVEPEDEEVAGDEAQDEFAAIFANEERPKIMITTRPRPSSELFVFVADLMALIPNAYYYRRQDFTVSQICRFASNKKFSHLVVLGEKQRVPTNMLICRLPEGPTAFFKVSNVRTSDRIPGMTGRTTSHVPELILNHFDTRLGHRVGRMLGSLFPHEPEFQGRQVVTFHNQRDYIFVRQHRYIFDKDRQENDKALLQELGPRFTLKLRWMADGVFSPQGQAEYEWIHKRKEMDTTRRKFHL